ncbi:hypothetical protein EJB05_34670, partial [Eragrostis curvula]
QQDLKQYKQADPRHRQNKTAQDVTQAKPKRTKIHHFPHHANAPRRRRLRLLFPTAGAAAVATTAPHGRGLVVGTPGMGEVGCEARWPLWSPFLPLLFFEPSFSSPILTDRRALAGKPVRAALLLNYDPSGPSRLLPVIAEQEGTELKAIDMQPFLDFVKRGNLQMEFFPMGLNQYLVTSIHEHWFCARCVNNTKPGGEGVIVMQLGSYLLVSLYDGSVGSASQAMVAVDQFSWNFNRRTH